MVKSRAVPICLEMDSGGCQILDFLLDAPIVVTHYHISAGGGTVLYICPLITVKAIKPAACEDGFLFFFFYELTGPAHDDQLRSVHTKSC